MLIQYIQVYFESQHQWNATWWLHWSVFSKASPQCFSVESYNVISAIRPLIPQKLVTIPVPPTPAFCPPTHCPTLSSCPLSHHAPSGGPELLPFDGGVSRVPRDIWSSSRPLISTWARNDMLTVFLYLPSWNWICITFHWLQSKYMY